MLVLPGSKAFSPARFARRAEALASAVPGAVLEEARFVHFASISSELDPRESEVLGALLQYGPQQNGALSGTNGSLFLVVPRPGTISPWSS
ncbi:MAG: hypothetical protein ABGY42_18165, partial [bacterium]